MSPILPRLAASRIHLLARVFPVTVLTGARQTGKSTLVQQPAVVGDREYLTLDDPAVLDQAVHAPDQLVARAERLVLDEVQRVPELLLTLKRAVDQRRVRGRYILTGSANLLLMRQVTESLAGRAGYVTLWPLTRREQLGFGSAGVWSELLATEPGAWRDLLAAQVAPEEPWDDVASRGGYPVPAYELIDERERRAWFEGYAVTYLERDVRRLSAIEQVVELRRLMKALALRIGNLVNQAELARDVNLSPSTVQRYVQLLETSYQLVRIPSYVLNRTKRLIKAPKFYWSDTGLAMYLSGEAAPRGAPRECRRAGPLDLGTTAGLAYRDPVLANGQGCGSRFRGRDPGSGPADRGQGGRVSVHIGRPIVNDVSGGVPGPRARRVAASHRFDDVLAHCQGAGRALVESRLIDRRSNDLDRQSHGSWHQCRCLELKATGASEASAFTGRRSVNSATMR